MGIQRPEAEFPCLVYFSCVSSERSMGGNGDPGFFMWRNCGGGLVGRRFCLLPWGCILILRQVLKNPKC